MLFHSLMGVRYCIIPFFSRTMRMRACILAFIHKHSFIHLKFNSIYSLLMNSSSVFSTGMRWRRSHLLTAADTHSMHSWSITQNREHCCRLSVLLSTFMRSFIHSHDFSSFHSLCCLSSLIHWQSFHLEFIDNSSFLMLADILLVGWLQHNPKDLETEKFWKKICKRELGADTSTPKTLQLKSSKTWRDYYLVRCLFIRDTNSWMMNDESSVGWIRVIIMLHWKRTLWQL